MNIHEYQAKAVLREFGVPVPRGIPAFSVEEAEKAAQQLGGPVWVVKAQIHAGGRGKAGGVKVVKTIEDVTREATRILHLDDPVADWLRTVNAAPAGVMGAAGTGHPLRQGAVADLVLFRARSFTELLSRPQADRTVLRSGRASAAVAPDHRELDAVIMSQG